MICDKKNLFVRKNSNCDKTQHSNCDQTQILIIIFFFFYKSLKLKLWQNSKTQIVTKIKKSICDKTQKPKLWQYSKIKFLRCT